MMLTVRKAPRACQSCRQHLLSIFENGFTSSASRSSARARISEIRPRPTAFALQQSSSTRKFSQTRRLATELDPTKEDGAHANIESVVREARQTFGETLPKDYLSAEEYILYERLYGPPLRETQASDLEYLPGEEEGVEEKEVRNVLLRENAHGEYEEVEIDPRIDFSYEISKLAEENAEGYLASELEEAAMMDEALEGEEALDSQTPSTWEEFDEKSADMFKEQHHEEIEEVDEVIEQRGPHIQGRNQREIDAITRLQRDLEAAAKTEPIEEEEEEDEEIWEEEEMEEEEDIEEDEGPDSDTIRTHPHTMAGRTGTFPTTISLPNYSFVAPISELMERTNIKHVQEAAEKAFGGKGLPYSTSTPGSKKHLPQKAIGLDASQHRMTEVEADAYMAAIMPGTYTSVTHTLVEVRKRLGANWLRKLLLKKGPGARVLDAGAGGAGAIAWREIAQAEWNVMVDQGEAAGEMPPGKTSVLTGSDTLRHRVSRFLDDTTFLPRLPDYVHSSVSEAHLDGGTPQPRKQYDIIVAPHALLHLKEDFRRKNMVQNLWSLLEPKGGVLILIEKGLPRGFEAIAGARSLLLDRHIASPGDTVSENEIQSPASDIARFADKEEGMIIAPCTTHEKCPMYLTPGMSFGRKDFCHFNQRFIRPPFLQKVLGASMRNHEDVKFSYLAVRRGVDMREHNKKLLQGDEATEQAFEGYEETDLPDQELTGGQASNVKFNALSLPRAVLPPLKRRGHVTLDLCTPSGKLERWTVPKSFSRTAYRDARKSKWGDLWALGAKTRVFRSPRLGRAAEASGKGGKLKGVRDGRQGKGGKKVKKNKFDIVMGADGFEGIEQDRHQSKFVVREKRTKGGRVWKPKRPITEEDLG